MNGHSAPHTPSAPPPPSPSGGFFASVRRLGIWRTQDRWAGGVAAGIAHRFGLDPLLVRGLFVVVTLFGGLGLVVYGLAWALLPEASDGRIHLEQAVRGHVDVALAGAAVTLIVGLSRPVLWWTSSWWAVPWVVVLGAIVAVVLLSRDRGAAPPYPGGPPTPGGPSGPDGPYPPQGPPPSGTATGVWPAHPTYPAGPTPPAYDIPETPVPQPPAADPAAPDTTAPPPPEGAGSSPAATEQHPPDPQDPTAEQATPPAPVDAAAAEERAAATPAPVDATEEFFAAGEPTTPLTRTDDTGRVVAQADTERLSDPAADETAGEPATARYAYQAEYPPTDAAGGGWGGGSGGGDGGGWGGSAAVPPQQPPTPPAPPVPGPGQRTTSLVLAIGLLGAAGIALAHHQGVLDANPWLVGGGSLLAVLGLGVLVSGMRGRSQGGIGGLALALAIVLVPTAAAAAALPGFARLGTTATTWAGDPTWAPTTVEDAEEGYSLVAGELVVDLTRLDADDEVTIPVSVTFGNLNLIVPEEGAMTIHAGVGAGEVTGRLEDDWTGPNLPWWGSTRTDHSLTNGVGINTTLSREGTGPEIVIDGEVSFGQINIEEAS